MNGRIFFKENILNVEEYLELRKLLEWELYSGTDIYTSLCNSLYTISVYYNQQIIGAGRVVGDGKICFYIQDIMVHPKYQNKGVGNQIMNRILCYLCKHAAPNAYIGLMSKLGKSGFYERYGFISRPNKEMGPGMVLRNLETNNRLKYEKAINENFMF